MRFWNTGLSLIVTVRYIRLHWHGFGRSVLYFQFNNSKFLWKLLTREIEVVFTFLTVSFFGPYHINPYCTCVHIVHGFILRSVSYWPYCTCVHIVHGFILRSVSYWPLLHLCSHFPRFHSSVRVILTPTALVFTLSTVSFFGPCRIDPYCTCDHIAYSLRYFTFRIIVTPTPFYGERLT